MVMAGTRAGSGTKIAIIAGWSWHSRHNLPFEENHAHPRCEIHFAGRSLRHLVHLHIPSSSSVVQISGKMPQGFDKCKERSAHIDEILNGLNRYNPETTTIFQEYVTQQCEEKFFDTYACLALLKL